MAMKSIMNTLFKAIESVITQAASLLDHYLHATMKLQMFGHILAEHYFSY